MDHLTASRHADDPPPTVGWSTSPGLVDYPQAVAAMQARAAAIASGNADELVWLLEHPPIYTAGTSASGTELVGPARLPVHQTGRGGRHTYHGPGQRIAYVMLNLKRRGGDVRAFVATLEDWLIGTLAEFGIRGETRPDRVGVWVRRPDKGDGVEDKIAAIGLRVSKWVTLHGVSLNVAPDLSHYAGIVPCGIADHGVTSLANLGAPASMEVVDNALRRHFERCFGPSIDADDPLRNVGAAAAQVAR
ncbi:MAG: lipoyl(octanoyl) transferase LipB [Hyphomicrobium sp.]|jgi:lipoyl(octanoyl) transferase